MIDQEPDGGEIPLSNFGKALAEPHIEPIKAATPQAKGLIERLQATLQDRPPVKFRLLGVRTLDEANRALPGLIAKHDKKYYVSPTESTSASEGAAGLRIRASGDEAC